MKVRVKQRPKRFSQMSCRCCTRIHFKEEAVDKQTLKEALEEISNTLDCDDVLTG
ncbi:hypothetical protein VCM_00120 [Pseudomonas phage VCM]|uniref:Uncharacterized protein n=1 Tax=Pseudomonas phage VCM TaxID=1729937 RepID=A0A0S4L3D4_9CAUD|nr:hypothetical protein VCM_00120 [Pseudomonas phage VCM]CUR44336.1 hypothetical protein VCM_00120 [Pseudomonas phage VCM]